MIHSSKAVPDLLQDIHEAEKQIEEGKGLDHQRAKKQALANMRRKHIITSQKFEMYLIRKNKELTKKLKRGSKAARRRQGRFID